MTNFKNTQQKKQYLNIHKISVVIIAQNEEKRIKKAIHSCLPFADEIVIIDGGSKDNTIKYTKDLGCKVYVNPWQGYGKQRNFGAKKAKYNWIFFIDCDEVVSKELSLSILRWKKILKPKTNAFLIRRIGNFFDKWLDNEIEYHIRLYNRKKFSVTEDLVHEKVNAKSTTKLNGILWHYGFCSINDHIKRFNNYTSLDAQNDYSNSKKFSLLRLILKPQARFWQKYILHKLFKKGITGLIVAILWVYYDFLKEIKLYELYWKNKEKS